MVYSGITIPAKKLEPTFTFSLPLPLTMLCSWCGKEPTTEAQMDTGTMRKKAQLHQRAAKKWAKAARLHAEAFRAVFEAEAIESEANNVEVNTLKPVEKRKAW